MPCFCPCLLRACPQHSSKSNHLTSLLKTAHSSHLPRSRTEVLPGLARPSGMSSPISPPLASPSLTHRCSSNTPDKLLPQGLSTCRSHCPEAFFYRLRSTWLMPSPSPLASMWQPRVSTALTPLPCHIEYVLFIVCLPF